MIITLEKGSDREPKNSRERSGGFRDGHGWTTGQVQRRLGIRYRESIFDLERAGSIRRLPHPSGNPRGWVRWDPRSVENYVGQRAAELEDLARSLLKGEPE